MIRVIDAPCGAGKTSWAIQYMNGNSRNSFVYCTPFLDEIARVRSACGRSVILEPNVMGHTKIDHFNQLLAEGRSIAVTHTTFLNATEETLELIQDGNYTLILDEALDVVQKFNDVQSVAYDIKQSVGIDDIQFLLDTQSIEIDQDYKVHWRGRNYSISTPDDNIRFKYAAVEQLAKLGRLYCVQNILLVSVFPHEVFNAFSDTYVMTYLFQGSNLKYYADMFGLSYELCSVTKADSGAYEVIPYTDQIDLEWRAQCKELITLCSKPQINSKRALTRTWYDNASKDALERLRADLTHYFRYCCPDAAAAERMWTAPEDKKKKLVNKRYCWTRRLTAEERALPKDQLDDINKRRDCFVPLNSKATNAFRERSALAYCYNMRLNPKIRDFFVHFGVEPDEDSFSMYCLIQWICRSRLRDGEPITLWLPSGRMRNLFTDWLDGTI